MHEKCHAFIGGAADEGGGGSDPAEAFGDDLFGLLGFGFEEAGFAGVGIAVVGCSGGAGAAGNDVDVIGLPFVPEGFGEDFQECFCARVGGQKAGALEAGDGAHQDDAAFTPGDHLFAEMSQESEGGEHVYGGDLLVGSGVGGEEGADIGSGGVVDEEVDGLVADGSDDLSGGVFRGEVDGQ